MSAGAPWSVKGIDPKAREVAKDLARRSGMTLGEWLNRVILEDDVPDEVTSEAQVTDRPLRQGLSQSLAHGLPTPRLRAVPDPGAPEFARIAFALDRLTDRIEASETRTGLAINGVEHSVRQALARIEAAEREQQASAARLEGLLAEASAEQGYNGDRIRRLEAEAGPRSAEALRLIETRLARVQPEAVVETVLERLGDRLSTAEARTAAALDDLKRSLATLDRRLGAVEHEADPEPRFAALAETLGRRVDAVRAEVAERLTQAGGAGFEDRVAELAARVQDAERRSVQAVEAIGRQVLAMAEAVNRKLSDVDARGAEAIDQVGTEVARIAGAVELRLARAEQAQAEAFGRFEAELTRAVRTPGAAFAAASDIAPAEATPAGSPRPNEALTPAVDPLAAAIAALGPPPEPEPEPRPAAARDAEAALTDVATAAFGPELLARAEDASATDDAEDDVIDPPWRRLDLGAPELDVPADFAPIAEDPDDDLFEPEATLEEAPEEYSGASSTASAVGPQLSTREVIERARAAARAAQDTGQDERDIDTAAARVQAADVRARLGTKASGRLFQGFAVKPRRAPSSPLQTALMVAGGAAFLSVGAAGLTLMRPDGGGSQAAKIQSAEAPQAPARTAPRAAMALGPPPLTGSAGTTLPTFEQVRGDIEAGAPGAVGRLTALAEAGHAQATLYLAQLYDEGSAGLPRNPAEARRLTGQAAEAGDVKAMHNLGVYLFRGEGGAQDLAGAAQWFRKAAAAGVVESQYNLGLLYQSGSGVAKDESQARYWFRLAAARGDGEARRALAALKPAPASPAQR
ncbi:hypothetical protein [Phenylobacterium sp.]|uniref:SEL1-like repeat protein n=1 Tax=Phenylobacterium sp. TaxID=1871053 RepID=UPI00301CA5F8